MEVNESLLRAILATVARSTFAPADVYSIVSPRKGSEKQLAAYNLCDGKTPQAEIGKKTGIDKSNLSRTIASWISAGIVVRIGVDQHPLHVYPLTKENLKIAKE